MKSDTICNAVQWWGSQQIRNVFTHRAVNLQNPARLWKFHSPMEKEQYILRERRVFVQVKCVKRQPWFHWMLEQILTTNMLFPVSFVFCLGFLPYAAGNIVQVYEIAILSIFTFRCTDWKRTGLNFTDRRSGHYKSGTLPFNFCWRRVVVGGWQGLGREGRDEK